MDLLVGALGTALVEWSGLVALSQSDVGEASIDTAATTFSFPVRIVETPREVPSGRLALGGGKGGGETGGGDEKGKGKGSGPTTTRPTRATDDDASDSPPRARSRREGAGKMQQTTDRTSDERRAVSFDTAVKNSEARASNEVEEPSEDGASEATHAEWGSSSEAANGDADGSGVGPGGEGFPEGSVDGTITDPLIARAIQLYRERFRAWLAARFRVKGSGLSKAELKRLEVRATVRIDEQRRVAGYSITSSGNRAFDEAAHAALRSVNGLEIPPLPSRYPGPVQQQIRVTFVCREDACD